MSIQETKLLAIADAIREKEGSTGFIPAEDFAARILAIQDSASEYSMPLRLEVNPGAEVTAQNGEDVLTGTADADGDLTFLLPKPGTWTVTAALDGKEKTANVTVEDFALNFASRLPDGYTEVQYIQSSGSQYINTGMKRSGPLKMLMDVEPLKDGDSSKYFFASVYTPSSGSKYFMQAYWGTNGISGLLGSYTSGANSQINSNKTARRLRIEVDTDGKSISVDGEAKVFSNSNYSASMTNIVLLTYDSSNTYKLSAKLYSCQIFTNDVLVRDFVPCIDPDGVVGLYDLANDVFYKNAGSGVFTAGPAV